MAENLKSVQLLKKLHSSILVNELSEEDKIRYDWEQTVVQELRKLARKNYELEIREQNYKEKLNALANLYTELKTDLKTCYEKITYLENENKFLNQTNNLLKKQVDELKTNLPDKEDVCFEKVLHRQN